VSRKADDRREGDANAVNIALLLDAVATMFPARRAIEDGSRAIGYAELLEGAQRRAAWIVAHASRRPVVYLGTFRTEMAEVMFGAAFAGVAFIPVNYRLKPPEIAAAQRAARPGAVFVEERYRGLLQPEEGVVIVDVGEPVPSAVPPIEAPDTDGPAVCLFTSGTTATPKLAILTHENLSTYILNTVDAGSSAEDESILISAPPYHVAGVANVLSNIFRGRRIILRAQFDPVEWLETVRAERVTHAMVVPTMLARILDVLERRPELAPSSLMNLAYGGARASEGLVERALALLPTTVGLVNAYGLTETSSTIAMLGPEDHRSAAASADPRVRARLQSVGKPVPGIDVRVAREDGSAARAGEIGQLWVRGAQVSPGYVGRDTSIDGEGWFRSGDQAYLDADGYLYTAGRADDVVIRGGENIQPAEIEEVLERHPSVREAVVVGLPDEEWGQVLAALVVGDGGATEDELRDWVRSHLAGYKAPVRIRWSAELPRNDAGKVVRVQAQRILSEAREA
jgi:acyl-CoA synthetase (AMP-forming)/AMP-acid ligase II